MLGEPAIAIGNPYGLGLTVSTGVVSSVRRDVEVRPGLWQSYIQTDAAINPGNSGGALVDLDGNLIGINTAIRDDAEGIGFAIPAGRARKVVDDVLVYGALRAPWLGIDATDVSARRLAGTPWPKGAVLIDDVHPGGPGEDAGLLAGDLVVEADGRPVASRADLSSFLADRAPGAAVRLTVVRGGRSSSVTVRTEAVPPHIGAYVRDRVWQARFAVQQGALAATSVTHGGAWSAAGLQSGDLLVAIDGVRLKNEAEVDQLLGRAKGRHRDTVLVLVARGRSTASLRLPI
jgi:serine protease Do